MPKPTTIKHRIPFTDGRPVIDALLYAPNVKEGVPVRLLLNTGADVTMVREDLAREFDLKPLREMTAVGPHIPEGARTAIYEMLIGILIPVPGLVQPVNLGFMSEFASVPDTFGGLDGCLGLDFLRRLRFTYDGADQAFTFVVPPELQPEAFRAELSRRIRNVRKAN